MCSPKAMKFPTLIPPILGLAEGTVKRVPSNAPSNYGTNRGAVRFVGNSWVWVRNKSHEKLN